MKTRTGRRIQWLLLGTLSFLLLVALALVRANAQAPARGSISAGAYDPHNPPPFEGFLASPSAPIRFLASERGRELLSRAPGAGAKAILRALQTRGKAPIDTHTLSRFQPQLAAIAQAELASGEAAQPPPMPRFGSSMIAAPVVSGTCGTANGTVFNLEPALSALPQNEESVDFLLDGVAAGADLVAQGANDFRGFFGSLPGVTGYYVNRATMGCGTQFEGALPALPRTILAGTVGSGGDPVVAADPTHSAFFMADVHFDPFVTGIGLFRSTAANLLSMVNCPNGTHTAAQSATCWPAGKLINPRPFPFTAFFDDKPHMAVDPRSAPLAVGAAVGAGDVYVTDTLFTFFGLFSGIELVACTNDLSSCSAPVIISGGDAATQFSHVTVRPDGGITVSWINVHGGAFDIKYARCTPQGAPVTPACFPATLVHSETQPLPFGGSLAAEDFRIATYPKHDHRLNADGSTQTFVVWDRCKTPLFSGTCPDADIMMKTSSNNGATWSALIPVAAAGNDQFFPWVKSDASQKVVNINYYDNLSDPTFQHRVQLKMTQILPGTTVVTAPTTITTLLDDPAGDPVLGGTFFGDYIGLAARGTGAAGASRAYSGFTYNERQGTYNGAAAPQQDNHIGLANY